MLLARRPAPRPVVPRRRPATTRASAEPSAAAAPAPKLVGDESVGADGLGPLPIPSYDAAAWARHRSPARYLRHAVTAPTSAVLRNLLLPASLSCVFTAALAAYSGLRPAAWPPLPAVGLAPLGLTSSALSLLLVFRTNSSYQRFVEARTAWGAVVNRCRDLVRECCTFFGPEDAPARAAVARWAVAFAHSARCHMREPPHVLGQQLAERGVLRPGELAALVAARHRPNYCLMVLGGLVAARVRDPSVALRMDEDVRALGDSLGALERLYKTPIPPSYTRNTSRLLLLWFCFLPVALFSELKAWAILVAPLLTLILGAIDEIGVTLEEPGAILPTVELCDGINAQTAEIVACCDGVRDVVRSAAEQHRDAP